ncbi:MAG: aromatic ring-hydroxylating dioxygenase subunit alpha [Lautropia sp.]
MSDIGRLAHLRRPAAQLPVAAYFSESLHRRELNHLFDNGPGYRGHRLMVPEIGDYHALPAEREGRVLVRQPASGQPGGHAPGQASGNDADGGAGEIALLSNVCRHRQAIMLNGSGNTDAIVCPLHRWTYDLKGRLLGAPHFAEQPCLHLPSSRLQDWQGLLFEGPRDVAADLAGVACRADLDFSGYRLDHVHVHECPYNWKTFIEVYLEDYHVEPFHPGLGRMVDCDDLRWEFGDWYSVQTVGLHRDLKDPGTPAYRKWHDEILRFNGGRLPKYGAIWLTYFPNLMVEWYPNVLVVSSLIPRGPRHTTNVVEFYYPEEIVWFERGFVDAERAAYLETAAEDDEIAVRMDAGRQALLERGENQTGPYQSPMENGMQHFHEFLRRELGDVDRVAGGDSGIAAIEPRASRQDGQPRRVIRINGGRE